MKENDEIQKVKKRLIKKEREELEKAQKAEKKEKDDKAWDKRMKGKNTKRAEENKELKKRAIKNRTKIWFIFLSVLSVISVSIFILSISCGFNFFIALAIGVTFWLLCLGATLVIGYVVTPFMNEDYVQCFGAYIGWPLKPGLHFLFPYFGFEKIMSRVYLGQQMLELYLDEKDGNSGDVEFQDCSSSLKAFFFFRIVDGEKAVFDISDLLGSLSEKADHILRAFFGVYTLDEAIKLKSYFRIENVASLLDVSSDSPSQKISNKEMQKLFITKEEAQRTQFYKTLREWGVEPKSFAISDIEVPEDIKKQRARILTAEKDKEVAIIEIKTARSKAKTTVINAKAEAEKITEVGEGESRKLKAIKTNAEIEGIQAVDYTIQTEKWKAIGKNANVTIIEDSGSKTAEGVKMGVGIGATGKKIESKKEKS